MEIIECFIWSFDMIYEIQVITGYNPIIIGQSVYVFQVEWDNQLDNLIEFLKSSGYRVEDFFIKQIPILKFSEFRKELLDIENLRGNMYNI